MSSGMNTEQAKEYAKTMTYREAVSNVRFSKGIKYRKATMIKLRELAIIADRLDRKDEPKTQMKTQNSNLTFEKRKCIDCNFLTYMFGKTWCNIKCENPHDKVCDRFKPKDEPQTDCETCKHYNPNHEAIACERCLDGKYSRYEPQTERSE